MQCRPLPPLLLLHPMHVLQLHAQPGALRLQRDRLLLEHELAQGCGTRGSDVGLHHGRVPWRRSL